MAERWAKVVDHTRCIGCHACSTACKSENEVPVSVNRTYVKYVDVGTFPLARRAFQVTRCNQCEDPPCVTACPTAAMYQRLDGIVDFDKSICIGCKACIAACPYDAIFINPEDHSAEKCNFCAHRLEMGLEPACVVVCPTQAILVGDLADQTSAVAEIVQRHPVIVRRPEKETRPKLFYRGAHYTTVDPIAARRPDGGAFLWSEQATGKAQDVVSGHPEQANSSAAAVLSYDVPHKAPWDWRVSLYTWTKGIATGAYLVPLLLLWFGQITAESALWRWVAPVLSGTFLAITGLLLIWDLEHPFRFYLIFTRPQWRSWLVRGAFIINGYSAVLALHFAGSVLGNTALTTWPAIAGAPLALLMAVYTAYLFGQARARDLWQNTLLPPHLAVQALFVGAAAVMPFAARIEPGVMNIIFWIIAGGAAAHVTFVAGEFPLGHPTAHARLAVREMTHGRCRSFFWTGMVLVFAAMFTPWIGVLGGAMGLVGLLAWEHAYVQAGQSVPLA